MFLNRNRAAMAAAVFLTGGVLAAVPATAAHAAPPTVDCSVVDLAPEQIAVGIGRKANLTFDVGTDCEEDADLRWDMTFAEPGPQTGPTGPMLANHKLAPWSKRTYVPDGNYTWSVGPKSYAGSYDVGISAWIGADERADAPTRLPYSQQTFTVLHRTTFGATFNAAPEPRPVGSRIKITAKLRYANWATQRYEGFGALVTLQFRPDGSDDYVDVKQVWTDGAQVNTSVTAERSGTWRYHFAGDPKNLTAASNSKGDRVIVYK